MDIPLSDLESTARDIVRRQMLDEELESLTKGNVRKKVEQHFNLNPGALSVKEYKHPLNAAIQTAVDGFDEDATGKEKEVSMKKSEGRVENQKALRKSKTKADPKPQPTKKKRGESSREYKSAAFIATSDMEEEAEDGISSSGTKRASTHIISDDTAAEEVVTNLPPQKRRKIDNINDESPKAKAPEPKVAAQDDAEKSESEMSVLIDETPKKKKKKTTSKTRDKDEKKKKSASEKKGKKASQELSKDEEMIKRLKSFVTACGLRRPWVKLLAGCDTPSQQIKKLKEILAELGMSGRMSLDQAKKIKAKRELAKELEDVQSFAKATVGRSSRSKNTSKPEEESESDEESEEEMMPTKRNRRSALLSITAFLGDQSDDD